MGFDIECQLFSTINDFYLNDLIERSVYKRRKRIINIYRCLSQQKGFYYSHDRIHCLKNIMISLKYYVEHGFFTSKIPKIENYDGTIIGERPYD
jgi:hypothetical protein